MHGGAIDDIECTNLGAPHAIVEISGTRGRYIQRRSAQLQFKLMCRRSAVGRETGAVDQVTGGTESFQLHIDISVTTAMGIEIKTGIDAVQGGVAET